MVLLEVSRKLTQMVVLHTYIRDIVADVFHDFPQPLSSLNEITTGSFHILSNHRMTANMICTVHHSFIRSFIRLCVGKILAESLNRPQPKKIF
jgi:hypothetical protein